MSNAGLLRIVKSLQQHVQRSRRERPAGDEAQIINEFLAPHNLTAMEKCDILDEYRRRAEWHEAFGRR